MVKRTPLEIASNLLVPPADELHSKFKVTLNPAPASAEKYQEVMANLGFGVEFSDHLVSIKWQEERGWYDHEVRPYGPVAMDPACSVLHYGQECFEGIKAYRHQDGSIWTFRPAFNATRLNYSASRLALPQLPVTDFVGSLVALLRQDARWVPSTPGASLYLRPFMYASESFLGVRPSREVQYMVIASPSGPYFKNGFEPVSIYVTYDFHRAGPGGTGDAKTAGNYAASLLPQTIAAEKGYQQVCFLDQDYKHLEELGGMNVFVVYGNKVCTPELTGTILEGGTRGAILELLEDEGYEVEQKKIALQDLLADIRSGAVTEMFACGTAAVVTPIGCLGGEDFKENIPTGPVTKHIYDQITGIQYGLIPDKYDWLYRLV